MKHSASVHRSTPAQREARLAAVVANAKARGEKVPRGVKLIGCRDATPAERAYAKTLVPLARKCLLRSKAAAWEVKTFEAG